MKKKFTFSFGSTVIIQPGIPVIADIIDSPNRVLVVCDTNTEYIARNIIGFQRTPICVLAPGENSKKWDSVETILSAAHKAGLDRDGFFIAVGGGVIGDLTSFAASIYKRGAGLCIVATTLLGMIDASIGGKTGFDLFNLKNIVGTFYPASIVFMPTQTLSTLSEREWKSGMAELIKIAVLDEDDNFLSDLEQEQNPDHESLIEFIERAVQIKGKIIEYDPDETGFKRILLNLGHTFGHALESTAGLGKVSHGEAIAWGLARACVLGQRIGITPPDRAEKILAILQKSGYETGARHPLCSDMNSLLEAMQSDKKKKLNSLRFIVPALKSAVVLSAETIDPDILHSVLDY
ncbi:3-dehydroquinate synthase [Spirochaetia bacterium]|nr:3-dehydroquinate synthase [Spirochaetia bacterium]GHU30126.1 3-dehydroquinate synthase [Spirochaetia bacterium]